MNALLLLLLSIVPQPDGVFRERVDVIEVNHLYFPDDGRWMMDQIIFREWKGDRFEIVDVYRKATIAGYPERDWTRGGYRMLWTEKNALREVRAYGIRETWTTSDDDPEKLERERLPLQDRRQFQKIPDPPPFTYEIPSEQPPTNDD
jgi:hypothetical protein